MICYAEYPGRRQGGDRGRGSYRTVWQCTWKGQQSWIERSQGQGQGRGQGKGWGRGEGWRWGTGEIPGQLFNTFMVVEGRGVWSCIPMLPCASGRCCTCAVSNIISFYIMIYHIMSCHIISYHIMSYHIRSQQDKRTGWWWCFVKALDTGYEKQVTRNKTERQRERKAGETYDMTDRQSEQLDEASWMHKNDNKNNDREGEISMDAMLT